MSHVGYGQNGEVMTSSGTFIVFASGAEGPQGPQGIQGIAGPSGATGLSGTVGAQGIQGLTGISGTIGAQGIQGLTGPSGADGMQGLTGPQGIQGLTGISGTVGTQGIQGLTGPSGNDGIQGIQGLTGISGTVGTQGIAGPSGATGLTGASGTVGTQGIQGIAGPSGNDGIQGLTGPSGADGPQGIQGIQGVQGVPGSGGGGNVVAGDSVVVGSVGSAIQDMKSHTFAASALSVGDQIELEAWGTNDDATQNGDIFLYFGGAGGQYIGPNVEGGPGLGGGQWHFKIFISITGPATQDVSTLAHLSNASAPASATHRTERHSATQAISSAIELLIRGQNIDGSNNDAVVVRGWKVTHIPSGGGGGTSGGAEILNSEIADASHVTADSVERNMHTYDLPANKMGANGDSLKLSAWCTGGNQNDGETWRLKFDGVEIAQINTTLSFTFDVRLTLDVTVTRRAASGAGSADFRCVWKAYDAAGQQVYADTTLVRSAIDWTQILTILVTAQEPAGNSPYTMLQHQHLIEYQPAP